MSCNAETEAKRILDSITQGMSFELPDIDFSDSSWDLPESLVQALAKAPDPVTIEALTTKEIGGTGVFDTLMTTLRVHLSDEYERGRITGAEYVKTYIALTEAALTNSVQFLLQRDTAYWQAITAQINAQSTRVGLETAKAQYLATKGAALTARAQYGLTAMKVATEDITYCIQQEQHEAARAQTRDTLTNGDPVRGSIGKQKELYSQQITSYQRSSETNAVQVLKDAWIAHKSIDEGIDTPAAFNATAISSAISALIRNNGLS